MMQKTCVLLSSLMVLIAFILSSKAGLYYGRLYPVSIQQRNDTLTQSNSSNVLSFIT